MRSVVADWRSVLLLSVTARLQLDWRILPTRVSGVVVHKTDDWSLFGYSGFSIHPLGYMELEAFFLFQGRNPPPPPRVPSPFTFLSVSLLCRLRFTSHNIHYISPITRHCHANILPSTGQENNIAQPKTDKWFSSPSQFSTFFII